jgi:hypothetical protein
MNRKLRLELRWFLALFVEVSMIAVAAAICRSVAAGRFAAWVPAMFWFWLGLRIEGLRHAYFACQLSDRDELDSRVQGLFSASRWRQGRAIYYLDAVCGARFGSAQFGRRFTKKANMWREWYVENSDRLVWDDALSVYVVSN